MSHTIFVTVYLVVMGLLIVGVDVLFLREYFWLRLGVNVGIVAVFALAYLLLLRDAFK
ncbi:MULTISPECIES: hypothetical protein [unclassified Leucobacter]|uniref:hypothetical protein n=1 Tax=unclassified Leucobacter TaxID=2621730 RepID=UPI0012E00A13|nr:hypothetical protein [Leucobacter sp. Ag1]